jgi:hypothetical protein
MPAGVVGAGNKQRPIRRGATKHMLEPDCRSIAVLFESRLSRQSVDLPRPPTTAPSHSSRTAIEDDVQENMF